MASSVEVMPKRKLEECEFEGGSDGEPEAQSEDSNSSVNTSSSTDVPSNTHDNGNYSFKSTILVCTLHVLVFFTYLS